MNESQVVRNMFYGDGYSCKKITNCKYQRYLLDTKGNEDILDTAIREKGIKLIIAPTGAGKSYSLIDRARKLTAQDKDCKVVITVPSRTLALQTGNQNGIYAMVGGSYFDENSQIITATYEKMFEVENYILTQRALNQKTKIHLILDESHLLTTQHLFREQAIKSIIHYIEKNYFESVLLVTATPAPMSLFRCDEIIHFECQNKMPAIDKIEMVIVDDVTEYIKNLNYDEEFPFIRLNNKPLIDEIIRDIPQNIVRITKDDKNKTYYKDIVDNSRINSTGIDGVLVTSVLEAGVNITEYPSNILPMAVFNDYKISADDIEQFLNRIRRTTNNHIKCARVVIKRPKERELKAELVTKDGKVVCKFSDVSIKLGNFYIDDVSKMDTVADGDYKIRIGIGGKVFYRNMKVASIGGTDISRYSKEDPMPLMYEKIGFRPFLHILKSNHKSIDSFQDALQDYVDALQAKRESRKLKEKLSDDEMDDLQITDEVLIEKMVKGAIDEKGELKDCLSYADKKIQVDKRILYMVSYNQFQRQYYYNHEFLQKELIARMNTKVIIQDKDIEKGVHSSYNTDDIWEDIEHIRQMIVCEDEFWKALMGMDNIYFHLKIKFKEILEIKKQSHLVELLRELDKVGIVGKVALKVLVSSKSKAKITKYINCYKMIIHNQSLSRFSGLDIKEIPFYNKSQKEKMQAVIYCYLQQKGQTCYKVTDTLTEEIITFYKESFPLSVKLPTKRQIKNKIKQMYKSKGSDTVRSELHVKETDIFELVKADYE